MILPRLILCLTVLAFSGASAAEPTPAPKKPAPAKPAPKPAAKKPKPTAKPAPSKGDIALAAARKCDKNKNGAISGGEVSDLRLAFRDPKNFLDLFDDNGNGALDDQEVNRINEKLRPPKKK